MNFHFDAQCDIFFPRQDRFKYEYLIFQMFCDYKTNEIILGEKSPKSL